MYYTVFCVLNIPAYQYHTRSCISSVVNIVDGDATVEYKNSALDTRVSHDSTVEAAGPAGLPTYQMNMIGRPTMWQPVLFPALLFPASNAARRKQTTDLTGMDTSLWQRRPRTVCIQNCSL